MTLSISVGSSWKLQIDAVARSFFLYTDLLRLYIHKNGFCQVELLDRMKDFNIFFFWLPHVPVYFSLLYPSVFTYDQHRLVAVVGSFGSTKQIS